VRRSELVRVLESVPEFPHPRADREQLVSPAEAAATLLEAAVRFDGLEGRSVLDLGCGTGRLAIGAALLGAVRVRGLDVELEAVEVARSAAARLGAKIEFAVGDIRSARGTAEIVVMNPPFGAQRRHADRPFWDRAFALAERAVYAFALADSRSFIARQAVARQAHIVEVTPVPWSLGRTLPHHERRHVPLDVDLWVLRTARPE
jgi:putative methylase